MPDKTARIKDVCGTVVPFERDRRHSPKPDDVNCLLIARTVAGRVQLITSFRVGPERSPSRVRRKIKGGRASERAVDAASRSLLFSFLFRFVLFARHDVIGRDGGSQTTHETESCALNSSGPPSTGNYSEGMIDNTCNFVESTKKQRRSEDRARKHNEYLLHSFRWEGNRL